MDLSSYKAFLFDLDGCLRYGHEPAPGAIPLLETLRRRGKSILVLTNTSAKGADGLARELQGIGLNLAPAEIQTTFDAAGEYIRYRFGPTRVLCLGTPALQERLGRDGHEVLPLSRYREAKAVVVGRDLEFNIERMVAAAKAIDEGAAFIALNNDVRMPVEGGDYTAAVGPLVAAIGTLAYKSPEVLGKPSVAFFELALRRLGITAPEAVMIGDNVETDIKGGKAAGLFSILVTESNVKPTADPTQADLAVHSLKHLLTFIH
ncbi:MAG TPA: HAD-IIA family hydrolase [Candidatus Tectomicrobia bacterium]|nr:HAD-IIA family hydrolase [Candidatus Tectomicrobia bacterium]